MKIVLATGIYPPDIGGPATYVHELAQEFSQRGLEVVVVTYGQDSKAPRFQGSKQDWEVVRVSKAWGPLLRWWRYSKALKENGSNADAVIAFSSVSCGVPLWLARLKKPKKILRLGGDFFWERYTDRGGRLGLREWYEKPPLVYSFIRLFVARLLCSFDHIVFSTRFQEEIYEKHYKRLPQHSVIENALPAISNQQSAVRTPHQPFRLLFVGRFVGFKNLPVLIEAVAKLDGVTLTMVGDGPLRTLLVTRYSLLIKQEKVRFLEPVHGEEKQRIFAEHDLLILPSLTEISPNVALEALAAGLSVLLTKETGLSEELRRGMVICDCSTEEAMVSSLNHVISNYGQIASLSARPSPTRSWGDVATDYCKL
jgi:glycosyltransferase involved in cell wall biosynthesis